MNAPAPVQIREFILISTCDQPSRYRLFGELRMTDDDSDTSRTKVETYIPAYQKEIWQAHAEELSMSQSEFVRTMVQAGRRGFGADETDEQADLDGNSVQPTSSDTTPGGNDLEDWLLDVLDGEACSWEELVERMTEDVEEQLDTVLEQLQRENRIQYSGRSGGYVKTESD